MKTGSFSNNLYHPAHNIFTTTVPVIGYAGITTGNYPVFFSLYDPVKKQVPVTASEQDNIADTHA